MTSSTQLDKNLGFSDLEFLETLPKNNDTFLKSLFDQTQNYRDIHKNGAFPYKQYNLLRTLVQVSGTKKVLELGTALGLTAIAMTIDSPDTVVDSIDRNPENLIIAEKNLEMAGVADRVFLHNKDFMEFLKDVPSQKYDLVFFDGFSARISLFLEMESKLKIGGFMICANLWSLDKNKPYHRMQDTKHYRNFFFFEDTGVAIKSTS